jgi:cellulose synthase/poly-beta-1,6-N-acetylglucosamine synthase-like glycosyltransferase
MLQTLRKRGVTLSWLGSRPGNDKRAALLVPQFNEGSFLDLESRLKYYHDLALQYDSILDVIIIDDGSTDDSLGSIKSYKANNNSQFYVAAVYPNCNKVGALYMTILSIEHDYIIFSDFDTDLAHVDDLVTSFKLLDENPKMMGCYFRMLPFEGSGSIFLFQQLEYSMARSLYTLHKRESTVPVMPGAGCCYKRKTIKEIYSIHSGLRSGEDREATLLGLKLGYSTFYSNDVLSLTRPPLSAKALIRQRIRWNLGYLETFTKEKRYYIHLIKKSTRIGIRTVVDICTINVAILSPLIFLLLSLTSWKFSLLFFVLNYFSCLLLSINALLMTPGESSEFRGKRLVSLLYYPLYKVPLECIAWIGAVIAFYKKRPRSA